MDSEVIRWLLDSDVSIQYQVHRDLLFSDENITAPLQRRIEQEGWGKDFLLRRGQNGHWGRGYYQPKWISTHYTLLDLKNLGISPLCKPIRETVALSLQPEKGIDGGLYPISTLRVSDVCVNGMFLNVASYFRAEADALYSIVDFLLSQWMPDGGFNCRSNRSGATHSSLHTTISVLEGIHEYRQNGYPYRLDELLGAEAASREFILQHRLFLSDKSGELIDKKMLMLSYPSRWYYDILRALDYFRVSHTRYDCRMANAFSALLEKQRSDGTWILNAPHPGEVHFAMEQAGKPSRWNTLRALRALEYYNWA